MLNKIPVWVISTLVYVIGGGIILAMLFYT